MFEKDLKKYSTQCQGMLKEYNKFLNMAADAGNIRLAQQVKHTISQIQEDERSLFDKAFTGVQARSMHVENASCC
eukprot:9302785-Karenia_brevis.AAC.1